jgi:zinc protease
VAFYAGEIPFSEDLELKTQALSEVLNIQIIEELREKIQGIYGGGTFASLEKVPYGNYSFVLQLPCGPEKVDTLLKTVKREFEDMAKKGPDPSYLDKVKKQWLETNKTQMKENSVWLEQLLGLKAQGGDPARFLEYEKYVNALTPKDVQQAANLILNGKNQFFAVLMPESVSPPNTMANRKVNVQQTIELSKPEFQIDLYDNGDVDGDSVTVYFNGQVVVGKRMLTDKPITIKLKANPGRSNELVMYANNLGSIPPNTALMKVTAGDKTYEIRLESDTDKSGAVVFKLKQ